MNRSWKIVGCMTALLFGATLAEGAFQQDERSIPRRLRREKVTTEQKERDVKESTLTSEQLARKREMSERVKMRFNKWVLNPVKRLHPRRRPGPPNKETAAARQERMKGHVSALVPHRYPAGRSTDSATGATTNATPATYRTTEEVR